MKRKIVTLLGVAALSCAIMTGCGSKDAQTEAPAQETEETAEADTTKADAAEETKEADTEEAEATTEEAEETAAPLEDGVYTAEFDTDSGMFHVNEANDGKGVLTVENGKMTIHVSLASKKIVNLYPGLAEDAQKDGAELLEPTTDTVTYSDGESEEVYGFDIPVPALDKEFDVALIGEKGTWYDHKVSVTSDERSVAWTARAICPGRCAMEREDKDEKKNLDEIDRNSDSSTACNRSDRYFHDKLCGGEYRRTD